MLAIALRSAVTLDKGPLKESAAGNKLRRSSVATYTDSASNRRRNKAEGTKQTENDALYTPRLCSVGLFVAVANGRDTS